ncbi:17120_t:CDS:2 [Cetraspora pellucida]|uniref:17120_t:CDS:1 n=1 Tax=Cetraspora pellucida TaxID=1433469 RepID=A0ACA9KL39_9GLOM|nr:17120_t:CDS:2 [Cetraspora pellucida]
MQIKNNQSLTENQKVRLNQHRIDKLKSLSNQLYDQINAEIPKIDDYTQLLDGRVIDHKIRSLNDENLSGRRNTEKLQQERRDRLNLFLKERELNNYDNYNRLIERYYNWKWVQELANSGTLANSIMNLNQTLLSSEKNKEDLINLRKLRFNNLLYDLIQSNMKEDTDKSQFEDSRIYNTLIQGLDQNYLTPLKSIEKLQELRKELGSKLQLSTNNSQRVKNFDEALNSLKDDFNSGTPLMKRMINDYVATFPEAIYQDEDRDWYFIDKNSEQLKKEISSLKIKDVDNFINNLFKKNHIYKLISDIFDQEDDIVNFSRMVEPDDNEITFLKRIKSFMKDYRYLNKINKLLGEKDSKNIDMKDSKDLEQDKKRKRIDNDDSDLQEKDNSHDEKREKLNEDDFLPEKKI